MVRHPCVLAGTGGCLSDFMVGVLTVLRLIALWAYIGMFSGAPFGIRGKVLIA